MPQAQFPAPRDDLGAALAPFDALVELLTGGERHNRLNMTCARGNMTEFGHRALPQSRR
jgi:hypothetical protein